MINNNLSIYHRTVNISFFNFILYPFQLCRNSSKNWERVVTQSITTVFDPWYYSNDGFTSIVLIRQRTFLDIPNKVSKINTFETNALFYYFQISWLTLYTTSTVWKTLRCFSVIRISSAQSICSNICTIWKIVIRPFADLISNPGKRGFV